MKPWNKRPFEYRRLFNPAFCAVIIIRAMKEYKRVSGKAMPFSLTFLILPLCLYSESRKYFLKYQKRSLLKIVTDNPQILVGFSKRTKALLPYTLEGLGYAFQIMAIDVNNDGTISVLKGGIMATIKGTDEVQECQKVAIILGRAFAKTGSKATIFSTLGVKP